MNKIIGAIWIITYLVYYKPVIVAGMPDIAEFEIPRWAFKMLIDSVNDPCPMCGRKKREKAFQILNREFSQGKIIKGNESCQFIKTEECGPYEMLTFLYKTREFYKQADGNVLDRFPLLIFRFHTKADHLIGISEEDYTDNSLVNKFKLIRKNKKFETKIIIIKYKYGDGSTFNYFQSANKIQIHCKILHIK
ncbi:MAG: hypothetical protein SVZ03_12855 [Spirochaetota bacterium]|nr:hypothetical protein [Spirochaetota bacterium]